MRQTIEKKNKGAEEEIKDILCQGGKKSGGRSWKTENQEETGCDMKSSEFGREPWPKWTEGKDKGTVIFTFSGRPERKTRSWYWKEAQQPTVGGVGQLRECGKHREGNAFTRPESKKAWEKV